MGKLPILYKKQNGSVFHKFPGSLLQTPRIYFAQRLLTKQPEYPLQVFFLGKNSALKTEQLQPHDHNSRPNLKILFILRVTI